MPHTNIEIPEQLPIYGHKEMVAFPYMIFPVFVDDHDVQIFTEADKYEKLVAIVLRRTEGTGDAASDLSGIGTLCRVNQIKKTGDGKFKVTLEGLNRLKILELDHSGPVT